VAGEAHAARPSVAGLLNKQSGRPRLLMRMRWQEALCFWWITARELLDAQRSRRSYASAGPHMWSPTNKRRIRSLIAEAA